MKLIQPKDNIGEEMMEVINPNHFLTIEMETDLKDDPKVQVLSNMCYHISGYTVDEGRVVIASYAYEELLLMKKDYAMLMQWLSNSITDRIGNNIFNVWSTSETKNT